MRLSLKVDNYLQAHEEFHHDSAKMVSPLCCHAHPATWDMSLYKLVEVESL